MFWKRPSPNRDSMQSLHAAIDFLHELYAGRALCRDEFHLIDSEIAAGAILNPRLSKHHCDPMPWRGEAAEQHQLAH